MAIDMSKMKKKLNKLNNKGGNGARYFKMEIGNTYEIRILPTPDGDPFKQFFVHYRVGDSAPFLSPKKNFNEDDALDRFVRKLYDEGSDESRNMARELSAKARFFSPVIVRGHEDDGPKVWSYSKTVYQELLKTVLDPDFGDITDPSSGFDLKVTYDKNAGKMYPETTVRPRPKASKLSKDESQVEEWLANLPDIDAMQSRKTPAEVQEILDAFLMSDGADPEALASESTRAGGNSRVASALADLV
jgi:hypothetical protein|tara:strand:- start:170 stop:907 length:738 start_codon:yes stop_codon:yes gene_type:complete